MKFATTDEKPEYEFSHHELSNGMYTSTSLEGIEALKLEFVELAKIAKLHATDKFLVRVSYWRHYGLDADDQDKFLMEWNNLTMRDIAKIIYSEESMKIYDLLIQVTDSFDPAFWQNVATAGQSAQPLELPELDVGP